MSKHLKETVSISRDLKMDEISKENLRYSDASLKSVTQKFLKEPLTVESVDKKFRQMTESSSNSESIKLKVKKNKKPERAIFYDIFIKPKENKIQEIIEKRKQKLNSVSVTLPTVKNKIYISNKITVDGKVLGMNTNLNGPKVDTSSLSLINEKDENKKLKEQNNLSQSYKNNELLKSNLSLYFNNISIEKEIDTSLLNKYLYDKFILNQNSSNDAKKSYFNQLIQIKPPKGVNSISSNPFIENQGFSPSIPSLDIDDMNTNINELLIRAKGGIKNGDITKEAHMAFYLGQLSEKEQKYENAFKFYKKYFLSAKLLDDIYGTELALNRIGCIFANLFDFKQSIYYNDKHKEISTHNLNTFVCYYNSGICNRMLENFEEGTKDFDNAIKLAEEENDLESYTLCLAQLAIINLFLGNINEFISYSNEFFIKNKTLNHKDMELEMDLLNGFIYSYLQNYDISKDFYKKALIKSEECLNIDKLQLSLLNIGMVEAEKNIDEYMNCVIEGKEFEREIEPEYIPPTHKLNKSIGSEISVGKSTTEANDSSGINYSKITETEVSYAEYRKNMSNRRIVSKSKKSEKSISKGKTTTKTSKTSKTTKSKSKEKTKTQKEKKVKTKLNKYIKEEEENELMIGGGIMIEEEEYETTQMVGGGVMIDELLETTSSKKMMIGGGKMGDESIKSDTLMSGMYGGGEIIEPSDEKEVMVGGGEIIEPSDEREVMVGGGEIIEPSDEREVMVGGGEIIEPSDEREVMVGGGEIIEPSDEREVMVGGGEIIEPSDEREVMVGGGEMIDVESDGDVEMMIGGGEMIGDVECDGEVEMMIGGGEMIGDVECDGEVEMMIGGGEMIGDVEYNGDAEMMIGGGEMIGDDECDGEVEMMVGGGEMIGDDVENIETFVEPEETA